MMDVAFDEALGILRCVSSGPTALADIEIFVAKMSLLQVRARAARGGCLVLVDAVDSVVHTKEAAAVLERAAAARLRPGDRTAIILASAIARLQAQRLTKDHPTGYFSDEAAALAWLLAEPEAS